MSKIYKSQSVTIDKERIVTIDVDVSQLISDYFSQYQEESDEFMPAELDGELSPEESEAETAVPPEAIAEEIIKQAEAEADAIIAAAQSEADKILVQAGITADSEREAASKDGYSKGYAQGLAETEQMRAEAKEIVANAYTEKEEILSRAEPAVVEMISKLTKKLLLDEVEINPAVIAILVKAGLSQTTLSGHIKIRVSKSDYENVMLKKEEILSSFEGISGLEFSEDPALAPGGCVIDTDFGTVDSSMDKQCNELINNLQYLYKNR